MTLPHSPHRGLPADLCEHADFLRRLARGLLGDGDAADDAVQDAYVAALERPPRGSSSAGWLARVSSRLGSRARRGQARRRHREQVAARPERLPSTVDQVERAETLRLVSDAVLRLAEPYRSTVLLHFYEGRTPAEIAEELGCSREAVYSRLRRSLEQLRTQLDRERGSRSDWLRALAPLASAPLDRTRLGASGVASGAGTGTAIMNTQVKLVGAVAALSLGVLGWTWSGPSRALEPEGTPASVDAGRELESPMTQRARTLESPESEAREVVEAAPPAAPVESPTIETALELTVTWESDGTPAEVPVRILEWSSPDPHASARRLHTDVEGHLRIVGLNPGRVLVVLTPGGSDAVEVAEGEVTRAQLSVPVGVTVGGQVVDAAGEPVPHAHLWLSAYGHPSEGCVCGRADAQGSFRLRDVGAGHGLAAIAPGHAPSPVLVVEGEPGDERRMTLQLEGEGGTVRGVVIDGGGQPLADVRVRVWGREAAPRSAPSGTHRAAGIPPLDARTDVEGRFEIMGVPLGRARVLARGAGLAPTEEAVEVRSAPGGELVLRLVAAASLAGTLRDARGEPVAGARMMHGGYADFGSAYTESAADGTFRLTDLPPGSVRIVIESDAGRLAEELELVPGQERRWDPVLPDSASLRARVVDENGAPWSGWRVDAVSSRPVQGRTLWSDQVRTDEAGRIDLRGAPDDTIRLTVFAERGDLQSVASTTTRPGEPEAQIVVPRSKLAKGSVAGTLVGPGGEGVRADLRILPMTGGGWGPEGFAEAGTGRFEIDGLREGTFRLTVEPDGFPERTLSGIVLGPGEELDLGTIELEPAGFVELLVDGSPDPAGYERVRLAPLGSGGPVRGRVTNVEAHELRDQPLLGGRYRLVATGSGVTLRWRDIEVLAGQVTTVEVSSTPGVPVRIEGLRPDGEDEAWHSFALLTESGAGLLNHTELGPFDGPTAWELRLEPGRYRVRYSVGPERRVEEEFEVTDAGAATAIRLDPDA